MTWFKKNRTEFENPTGPLPVEPPGKVEPMEPVKKLDVNPRQKGMNSLLKGSRLNGDVIINCDLELSGDVVGNIYSKDDSSVFIKGTCKGNIETSKGQVGIEGELLEGNIKAGGDVTITGKFSGGTVKAGGKCYINGEFSGSVEAHEIEIGPLGIVDGNLSFQETISIGRGAKVQGSLIRLEPAAPVIQMPSKPVSIEDLDLAA